MDVVLLCDVSGSMSAVMAQVRETVRQVGRALSPQDRFGVVSFDTMGIINLPLAPIDLASVDDVADAMDVRGGTNIGNGFEVAIRCLNDAYTEAAQRGPPVPPGGALESSPSIASGPGERLAVVLLLSDGEDEHGATGPAIAALTTRARGSINQLAVDHPGVRVVVHSLGLREGHSAQTLRDYADTGNFGLGLYYFLQTQHDIRGSVGDCLGTMSAIAVCDLQIQVTACHWAPTNDTDTRAPIDLQMLHGDGEEKGDIPWQCGFYGADSVGSAAGSRDMRVLLPPRIDIAMMAPTEQQSFILCVTPALALSDGPAAVAAPPAAVPAVVSSPRLADADLADYEDDEVGDAAVATDHEPVVPFPLGGADDKIAWSFAPTKSQCMSLRDLPTHITLRVSYKGFTRGHERTVITRRIALAGLLPDAGISAAMDVSTDGKEEKRSVPALSAPSRHGAADIDEDDALAPIIIPSDPQLIHVLTHICRIRVATLLQRLGPGADLLRAEMERLHALLMAIMSATISVDGTQSVFDEGILQALERDLGEALQRMASSHHLSVGQLGLFIQFAHGHLHQRSAWSINTMRATYTTPTQLAMRLRFLADDGAGGARAEAEKMALPYNPSAMSDEEKKRANDFAASIVPAKDRAESKKGRRTAAAATPSNPWDGDTWACPACTCLNTVTDMECAACVGPQPPVAPKVAGSSVVTSPALPLTDENVRLRKLADEEVSCYVTLDNWRAAPIGLGLVVHPRNIRERTRGLLPACELVEDYLSQAAYNNGVRLFVGGAAAAAAAAGGDLEDQESALNRDDENADEKHTIIKSSSRGRVNAWLPCYVNATNWKSARVFAPSAFSIIATQFNDLFQVEHALRVCARLMISMCVKFSVDRRASDRAIQMYADVHRVFLEMAREHPEIVIQASEKLRSFIASAELRRRKNTPDLGDLIQYLTIVNDVTWEDLAPSYIQESTRRAARSAGRITLAPIPSSRALADIWMERQSGGRVTLFNKLFLDVVAKPWLAVEEATPTVVSPPYVETKAAASLATTTAAPASGRVRASTDEVCRRYDANWGRLTHDTVRQLKDGLKSIMEINTLQEIYARLGAVMNYDAIAELLLWAIEHQVEGTAHEQVGLPSTGGPRLEAMHRRHQMWLHQQQQPEVELTHLPAPAPHVQEPHGGVADALNAFQQRAADFWTAVATAESIARSGPPSVTTPMATAAPSFGKMVSLPAPVAPAAAGTVMSVSATRVEVKIPTLLSSIVDEDTKRAAAAYTVVANSATAMPIADDGHHVGTSLMCACHRCLTNRVADERYSVWRQAIPNRHALLKAIRSNVAPSTAQPSSSPSSSSSSSSSNKDVTTASSSASSSKPLAATSDPYHTLFFSRLSYDTSETDLRTALETFISQDGFAADPLPLERKDVVGKRQNKRRAATAQPDNLPSPPPRGAPWSSSSSSVPVAIMAAASSAAVPHVEMKENKSKAIRLVAIGTAEVRRQEISSMIRAIHIVRHAITGASKGIAFVSFDSPATLALLLNQLTVRAYTPHEPQLSNGVPGQPSDPSTLDNQDKRGAALWVKGWPVLVDVMRRDLDPTWKPRHLGGGVGLGQTGRRGNDAWQDKLAQHLFPFTQYMLQTNVGASRLEYDEGNDHHIRLVNHAITMEEQAQLLVELNTLVFGRDTEMVYRATTLTPIYRYLQYFLTHQMCSVFTSHRAFTQGRMKITIEKLDSDRSTMIGWHRKSGDASSITQYGDHPIMLSWIIGADAWLEYRRDSSDHRCSSIIANSGALVYYGSAFNQSFEQRPHYWRASSSLPLPSSAAASSGALGPLYIVTVIGIMDESSGHPGPSMAAARKRARSARAAHP